MHFKVASLLALSAGVLAHVEERQVVTDSIGASVLLVLATAIPPESISQATANPSAFSAELASSLSAGKTPSWYQALPSDVKSYLPKLYPATNVASTTPASSGASSSSVAPSTTVFSSGSVVVTATGSPSSGNSTGSAVSSATLASTGGANSQRPSGTSSGSGSQSTGAASMPTAAFGAGVAGAIGILGMLAL